MWHTLLELNKQVKLVGILASTIKPSLKNNYAGKTPELAERAVTKWPDSSSSIQKDNAGDFAIPDRQKILVSSKGV